MRHCFNSAGGSWELNHIDNEADYDALRVLIECMEQTPTLSGAQVNALVKTQTATFARMLETGETWNQASSGPAFLSLNEDAFRDHMKAIDNDLGEQTAIVSQAFARYLEIGEMPAPYYPWRIAVILRRAKRPDMEKKFLSAWCRHFATGNGVRYAQLVERFEKLI